MVKIAVIGGGVAGISITRHLVSHPGAAGDPEIDIYDAAEQMGRGKPYIEDSGHLLLNIPSEEMTLTGSPDGFVDWLKTQSLPVCDYNPRKDFGAYSREVFQSLADSHGGIRAVHEQIVDIIYDAEEISYTVHTKTHDKKYDLVFLAMGQMNYRDPYGLKGTEKYVFNPYPVNARLDEAEGKIGIIGTGLSAIDCVRYLILERGMDQVHLFSRSGDMPSVRGETHHFEIRHFTEEAVESYIKDDLIPLDKIIALFKKEMDAQNIEESLFYRHPESTLEDLKHDIANSAEVGKLQYLIIALNPLFSRIFTYLSLTDKKIFMEEVHPYIDKNHSPMPIRVARQLVEWAESGRVAIVDGMKDVHHEGSFIVESDSGVYDMDWMINATGPEKDILKDESPLISNMVDRMLIGPGSLGGILVDRAHRVISPRYGTLRGMYAIGHLTFDSDYLSNSVNIIVENTKLMIDGALKQYS
ncbi:FAD/NAD(P)-binding protein [Lacicoccus alkaliphilus]|uniref:Uncharacterized NAD(P)/FAD-binding protein YdhS n=1 Tax=Lacicoccus alkaliphilus DSM 16010 TaxID=1123231 RepID=A0A1M7AEY7_9BACL|nr:FAD/NAD(P)-binding protein [Salinicoccus alkaliphilus]SHL41292.1 Uncharacterized NAD(P)/FAD-binding protein YdhS [Salinicoccus alkaliphilus DSM 16010]